MAENNAVPNVNIDERNSKSVKMRLDATGANKEDASTTVGVDANAFELVGDPSCDEGAAANDEECEASELTTSIDLAAAAFAPLSATKSVGNVERTLSPLLASSDVLGSILAAAMMP